MCSKIPFETRKDANQYIYEIGLSKKKYSKQIRDKSKGKLYPYVCNRCNKWHITSERQCRTRKQWIKLRG